MCSLACLYAGGFIGVATYFLTDVSGLKDWLYDHLFND